MKSLLLILSLLISSNFAFAAPVTAFDAEGCSVTATTAAHFKIDEDQFESKVKIDLSFTGQDILLPKMRVTFMEHAPTSASIEWSPVKIIRNKLQLFNNEMVDQIRSENGKPFAMEAKGQDGPFLVFETEPLDFSRSQNLVSLFLSQDEFYINLTTAQGDTWKAQITLSMTDAAFRKMTTQCFAAQTQGYLNEKGERHIPEKALAENKEDVRLSPAARFWSNGYGLTSYTWIKSLLPEAINIDQVLAAQKDQPDQITAQMNQLSVLLKQKQQVYGLLKQQSADPEFASINNQLADQYNQLATSYERFILLTGNSKESVESLIYKKQQEQVELSASIEKLKQQIVQEQASVNQKKTVFEKAKSDLDVLLVKIKEFEQVIVKSNARIQDIVGLNEHLQKTLTAQKEILVQKNAAEGELPATPWSVEEIKKKEQENEQRNTQIQVLTQLKDQLSAIVAESLQVSEKAQAQGQMSLAYLNATVEQRKLKKEIADEELWISQSDLVPHFTMATDEYFSSLHAEIESSASKIPKRDYNSEFDFYNTMYDQMEKDFTDKVAAAKKNGAVLISSIICMPNVLVDEKNRTHPCLTVDDMLNEKSVDVFFQGLPPQNINELLISVPKPWNEKTTKYEVLIDRFKTEIDGASPELQAIVNTWGSLRHVIWRWVTMQKEDGAFSICADPKAAEIFADKIFSPDYYRTVFECEKAEVQSHKDNYQALIVKLEESKLTLESAQSSFDAADLEFNTASNHFVKESLSSVTALKEQGGVTEYFKKCLLPLNEAEVCAKTIQDTILGAEAKLTEQNSVYLELVKSLVGHSTLQLNLLAAESKGLVEQVAKTEADKASYYQANNIETLTQQKNDLESQYIKNQELITSLMVQEKTNEGKLSQAKLDESSYAKEAQERVSEINGLIAKVEGLKPQLLDLCTALLPNGEELNRIDGEIQALLGQPEADRKKKVYTSCQIPDLNQFTLNPEFLSNPVVLPQR